MSREIELTRQELEELINNKELYLGLASRSIHIFPTETDKEEIIMNYEGDGYRPVKITIEFEYDEDIKLTEDEDRHFFLNVAENGDYIFSDHRLNKCRIKASNEDFQDLINCYFTEDGEDDKIDISRVMFDVSILDELKNSRLSNYASKQGCGFEPLTEGSKVQDFSDDRIEE